jgi:hypothetical protein
MHEVGFPPGVVNVVTGSTPVTGEALVASRDIDMVSFTGSTAVGTRIGEVGGRTMKRLLLELGGKGGALVFDDANLKTAIQMIGSVWTFHSGQICTAPTRAIIQRGVYDQVVEGLAKMATVLKVGDPYEPDTVVGPVITSAHRDRIESYVQAGRDEGGEILAGGARPEKPDRGFYVSPTLIAGCRAGMKVVQEEIFGPVIVALPFDDEDEGVALMNGTEFGLYDYVFSADTNKAFRVSKRLRAGNIGINTTQRNHNTPFGGTKQSGSAATAASSDCTRTPICNRSSGPASGKGFNGFDRPRRPVGLWAAASRAGVVRTRRDAVGTARHCRRHRARRPGVRRRRVLVRRRVPSHRDPARAGRDHVDAMVRPDRDAGVRGGQHDAHAPDDECVRRAVPASARQRQGVCHPRHVVGWTADHRDRRRSRRRRVRRARRSFRRARRAHRCRR